MHNTIFKGKTIYIEGTDFSGKTSLIKELLPYELNNNTFLSDRSIVTSIIYAQYFKRDFVNIEELESNFLNSLNSNKTFYWFLNPSDEEIERRMTLREETHIKDKNGVFEIKRLYKKFFKKYSYYANIEEYSGNEGKEYFLSIEEWANKLFNYNAILFDYDTLLTTVRAKQNKEINGYRLNYFMKNIDELSEYRTYAFNIIESKLYRAVDHKEAYEQEKHEREMIFSNLKFNTHVMIDKYKESIFSRRFISTNDSCFTFTQVNLRKDCIHFSFVFRSTEVEKMLPSDLFFVFQLSFEYLYWLDSYCKQKGIDTHFEILDIPIKIDIMLNSAHIID